MNNHFQTPFYLNSTDNGLELLCSDQKINAIRVDFLNGAAKHRRLKGGGLDQLIAKACGIRKLKSPRILDVTAGLGRDAFVLASLGCDVLMIERSEIIASLLEDGLKRLMSDPLANEIKLRLIQSDSIHYLSQLTSDFPDVILIDPMHPARQKSALVKKEMRLLRMVVGEDPDSEELLLTALSKAKHRVVVKRPRLGPILGNVVPTLTYSGKSTRFDVYQNNAYKL